MSLTPLDLRTALETYIEFGPQISRPAPERLRKRRPALEPRHVEAALAEAQRVVRTAEELVREFRAGRRDEASITLALRDQFSLACPRGGAAEALARHIPPPRRGLEHSRARLRIFSGRDVKIEQS